jgi:MFS family permease
LIGTIHATRKWSLSNAPDSSGDVFSLGGNAPTLVLHHSVTGPGTPPSTWAPLRAKAFRWLWLASLVSNVGTWMQTVGAQWLLVHAANAAILVSLVQTADMLPDVLFAVVGGVLADILDRRRLIIAVQSGLAVAGALLATLTFTGHMSPALLLMFTFVIGSGSVFITPAYQSLVPELVPREDVPSAVQLNSINVNIARAVGPAIAGLLIAHFGVGADFAINAGTFLVYAIAVLFWRPAQNITPQLPERFFPALRAGGRYVRYSPVVRRILLRATLFLVPASALWGLLPLVASRRLELGPSGYGLLLGALGVGAIAGATVMARVRAKFSVNGIVGLSSGFFCLALVAVALLHSTIAVVVVLIPTGATWVWMLATLNTTLQLFLPAWVRARGLSIYQMVLFGAQGFGALVWGVLADEFGLTVAFVSSAALLAVGTVSIRIWPLFETSHMDRSIVVRPDPELEFEAESNAGPVVVRTSYSIPPEREAEFFRAMSRVRDSRFRTGANEWGLYRNGEQPGEFEEIFFVASWEEHLRQHRERLTATDRSFEDEAKALSTTAPETHHLLSTELEDS